MEKANLISRQWKKQSLTEDMPPLLIVVISLLAQPSLQSDGSVVILERKYVGNVPAYFNKNFEDYKAGFESRGEL